MAKITDITKLHAEQGKITFILMQCEPETILVKSSKYKVDGIKEFWCLIFQRSKELRLKATLHFSYVVTWCINASEPQLGTEFLYVKKMWFAGSEAGLSSPPDTARSSWAHSSVTSGLSITQVRLIDLCISLVGVVSHLRNVCLGFWRSLERPPSFEHFSHLTVKKKSSSCR